MGAVTWLVNSEPDNADQSALFLLMPCARLLVCVCSCHPSQLDGQDSVVNFRETAPYAATPGMFLDAVGNLSRERSLYGYLAVGVPGTVMGLDHAIRTFHQLTGAPLAEVVRMASLTPARILGRDNEIGSIAPGKKADLVVLDAKLMVRQVYVDGMEQAP